MCLLYDGSTQRLSESGFMEKPGIEPATPGLQGKALIHYTTGASIEFQHLNVRQVIFQHNIRSKIIDNICMTPILK